MFKKFCRKYCLNKRIERSDLIAHHDVFNLIRSNMMLSDQNKQETLRPFVFYTDGGVIEEIFKYSIHQLFGHNSATLYSSKYLTPAQFQTGINLQAYIGRNASHEDLVLSQYRKNSYDPMVLFLPVEQFVQDKTEVETYKQITELTINNMNLHYTCLCKAFAVFANEKEINCSKSNVLKAFQGINSVASFLKLGLPIKKVTSPKD